MPHIWKGADALIKRRLTAFRAVGGPSCLKRERGRFFESAKFSEGRHMPADQDAATDPSLAGDEQEPSAEELAREEEARSETSVADLVEQDLDDPTTPSRRTPDGDPAPGSFDVPLEDLSSESTDAR